MTSAGRRSSPGGKVLLEGRREAGRGTLTSDLAERRVEQPGNLRRSARRCCGQRFDVEEEACWVRSIERLAILRLRDREGLKNPDMTHPLFSSASPGRLAPPLLERHTDPLLDAALARFSAEHPLMPVLAELPDLREKQGHTERRIEDNG